MNSIFISYRRAGTSGYGGRLQEDLRDHFGKERVFRDIDSIRPGTNFFDVISEAVAASGVVLALIGRNWLTVTDENGHRRIDNPDDFVRLEIESAFDQEVMVIPVLVEGASMPSTVALPEEIRRLAYIQAVELTDERWEYDVGRLVDCLEDVLAAGPTLVSSPVAAAEPDGVHGAAVGQIPAGDPAEALPRFKRQAALSGLGRRLAGVVRPHPRRALLIGLAAVVLALGVVVVVRPPGAARYGVPGVTGQDVDAARATLIKAGFAVTTRLQPDMSKRAGLVLAQDPPARVRARRGAVVLLSVVTDSGTVSVPSVAKLSKAAAITALETAGFVPLSIEQKSDTVAADFVISQNPPATATARQGSAVTITVSTGTVTPSSLGGKVTPGGNITPGATQPPIGRAVAADPIQAPHPKPTAPSPQVSGGPVASPPNPPSAPGCSADNLIGNGSYEAGLGNWTVLSGEPRIVAYGQSDSQARPAGYLGDSYVVGGPGATGTVAVIQQEVSLAPCQAGVAGGSKVMHHGGWLGGNGSREDTVQLVVSFKAGGSNVGGGCTLDGPTAAGRGGGTAMVELGGAPCPIPATATSAVLEVRFTSDGTASESTASYDNAYLWIA